MSDSSHCYFFLSVTGKNTGQTEILVVILKLVLLPLMESLLTLGKQSWAWALESGCLGLTLKSRARDILQKYKYKSNTVIPLLESLWWFAPYSGDENYNPCYKPTKPPCHAAPTYLFSLHPWYFHPHSPSSRRVIPLPLLTFVFSSIQPQKIHLFCLFYPSLTFSIFSLFYQIFCLIQPSVQLPLLQQVLPRSPRLGEFSVEVLITPRTSPWQQLSPYN